MKGVEGKQCLPYTVVYHYQYACDSASAKIAQMFLTVTVIFTVAVFIESPADCELWVLLIFCGQKLKICKIYHEICAVYGENIMSHSGVSQWYHMFQIGWTSVHDEERSGQVSDK